MFGSLNGELQAYKYIHHHTPNPWGCSRGSGPWAQAATQAPSSGPHTASLSRVSRPAAQPGGCADQRQKINPTPQTQLCAFTDSHCVAHSNTCTYFSMVSSTGTTRSLSIHTSCVLLKPESGNQQAQGRAQHVNTQPPLLHYFQRSSISRLSCHKSPSSLLHKSKIQKVVTLHDPVITMQLHRKT